MKYRGLSNSGVFFPVAIYTSSVMNQLLAVDLVSEIVKRITCVREDTRETMFRFQRLSVALRRGNTVALGSQT